MLKPEEIEITFALTDRGDSMVVTHKPTGIKRGIGPPLGKTPIVKLKQQMLGEIEAELVERGLTQYIVPAYPGPGRPRKKSNRR